LWVIISYKIIKFVSIFYKICCEKCFIQKKIEIQERKKPNKRKQEIIEKEKNQILNFFSKLN